MTRKPGIALLGTTTDQSEAAVWESILRAEGIPCLVRNNNPASFYQPSLGFAGYSFEVYVPATALRRAQEVIVPPRTSTRAAQPLSIVAAWILLPATVVGAALVALFALLR
jgi:hypothetical protein